MTSAQHSILLIHSSNQKLICFGPDLIVLRSLFLVTIFIFVISTSPLDHNERILDLYYMPSTKEYLSTSELYIYILNPEISA